MERKRWDGRQWILEEKSKPGLEVDKITVLIEDPETGELVKPNQEQED